MNPVTIGAGVCRLLKIPHQIETLESKASTCVGLLDQCATGALGAGFGAAAAGCCGGGAGTPDFRL